MSDERAFDEPLPWLAPVEDEDEPRGISARKMLAALMVVLVAAAIVGATFFWIGRRNAAVNGAPELIKAPAQPYKVKPPSAGGLDIAGESETNRPFVHHRMGIGEHIQGDSVRRLRHGAEERQ